MTAVPVAIGEPIPVKVTRYRCTSCPRTHSSKARARVHIARCWQNPDARGCKTCKHLEDWDGKEMCAVGVSLEGREECGNCHGLGEVFVGLLAATKYQTCGACGGEARAVKPGPIVHCPLWELSPDFEPASPEELTVPISQLVDGEWRQISDEEHLAQCLAQLREAGIADPCPDCFTPRVDGACKPCGIQAVFNADPDYREYSDAQARLDFGAWGPDSDRPYTFADALDDKATVVRLEAKFARAERDAKTDPGGCADCGRPERGHGERWHTHAGFQRHEAPPLAVRKARILARRNVRLGLPAWAPLSASVSSSPRS